MELARVQGIVIMVADTFILLAYSLFCSLSRLTCYIWPVTKAVVEAGDPAGPRDVMWRRSQSLLTVENYWIGSGVYN